MWPLLAMAALASGPTCVWSTTAEVHRPREIVLAGTSVPFKPASPVPDIRIDAQLHDFGDGPILHAQFTSDEFVLNASLDLGEPTPMTLLGTSLVYDGAGVVPEGSAVHITETRGDLVGIVPASVRLNEITLTEPRRFVSCSNVALRQPMARPGEPLPPADDVTTFNMHRAFDLALEPHGDETVPFTPTRTPMHVVRMEDRDRRSRFEYRDRFGAVWSGWSTVTTMRAYNLPELSIGRFESTERLGGPIAPTHRCERQVALHDRREQPVGHVRQGASIHARPSAYGMEVTVPWLDHRLFVESLEGCVPLR